VDLSYLAVIGGGKLGAGAAFKRSVELSNGDQVFLFLLVVKSVVGSCLACRQFATGSRSCSPAALAYTVWYRWMLLVVSILAAGAVEPPIFIGFSLLAAEEPSDSSFLPGAQQAAYID
jgi:hypothetical protein